jgi:prepilin-type N-terminal cleavage/methylation domain-containing protein
MIRNTSKGFTLIELLVVIAILGVLATVIFLAINPAEMMRKSRDAARLQEIVNLKKAIDTQIASKTAQIFVTVSCPYNNPCNSETGSRLSDGTGWLPVDLAEYMSVLPADPLNSQTSVRIADGSTVDPKIFFATNGSEYTLALYLESPNNLSMLTNDGGLNTSLYEIGTGLAFPLTLN